MTVPRVLHVAQPTTAGVARVAVDLVRDQVGRGWAVFLASPSGGDLAADAQAAGAHWMHWPAGRSPGRSVPAETWRLSRLVHQVDPDIVHLHSSKAGLAGRLAVRGRRPTVFQPHAWSFLALQGAPRSLALRWERIAVRWTSALAVVSVDEQETGRTEGIEAPYVPLPNGVDLERRRPSTPAERAAARSSLDLPHAPLAVCVGRLSQQKGQDVLLAAWPHVREVVPDAQLVLVGDGPDRAALERHLPDGARLVGDVADPASWLLAADVAVLPSRWEGMSLSLLEAMAHGCSVVASDVAGARTALTGGAGAVVPIDDVRALAAAVSGRLADKNLAAHEGALARARVEQDYDLAATTAHAAALYLDLLRR